MPEFMGTPGPWDVVFPEYGRPGIDADTEDGLLTIVVWGEEGADDESGIRGRTTREALSNARAIAAVPEMIEALQANLGFFESERNAAMGDGATRAAISWEDRATKTRTALAKALGEDGE